MTFLQQAQPPPASALQYISFSFDCDIPIHWYGVTVFQHLKRWFWPAGIVFDQTTVQLVRCRPGKAGRFVVTCRVEALPHFAAARRFGPFRQFAACLPAHQASTGQLTLPVGLAPSALRAEVGLALRRAAGEPEPQVFDFVGQDTEHGWKIDYVAVREAEVVALHASASRMGVVFTDVDLDVFAMRRAAWAAHPPTHRAETEAVLWVGEHSGLFAWFEGRQVRHSTAWSLKSDGVPGLDAWVRACATRVKDAGVSRWVVCAATPVGVSAVITASSELGLTPTLLDLSHFGVTHASLASAFIAFGLALRGWVDD